MRLLNLIFYISLTAIGSLSAQGNIPQPTHEVVKVAPDVLLAPQFENEYFNYYNGNGDLFEIKENRWDGANWVLNQRIYFTLNATGQPTQILFRKWKVDSLKLFDQDRTTIGYQANGLQNLHQVERWNQNEGVWKLHNLWTTTYYNNDKVKEDTYQYFTGGVQSGGTRYNYEYDTLDRKSQEIKLYWVNGIWVNGSKTDYSYPGLDEINFEALTRLSDSGAPWGLPYMRSTQSGTALQTIKVEEYNDTGSWFTHRIATSTYTNDGRILTLVDERWNFDIEKLKVDLTIESTYNTDKSIQQYVISQRNATLDTLYVWYILEYDYGNYPVSVHTPIRAASVSIFPNPTSDFVQVELQGNELSNITLLDLRGSVIARTKTAANSAELSLVGQPAGLYLLRVEQGDKVKVLPVVKN